MDEGVNRSDGLDCFTRSQVLLNKIKDSHQTCSSAGLGSNGMYLVDDLGLVHNAGGVVASVRHDGVHELLQLGQDDGLYPALLGVEPMQEVPVVPGVWNGSVSRRRVSLHGALSTAWTAYRRGERTRGS